MKRFLLISLLVLCSFFSYAQKLRAPAYPLITHDPYFSIWSFGDTLNKSPTRHWTGHDHSLTGIIKVDGRAYQFLGTAPIQVENLVPTAGRTPYQVTYTYNKPEEGWEKPSSNTTGWTTGPAPYDSAEFERSAILRTRFGKEVWYKREFNLNNTNFENPQLYISHDSEVEVYLNGVKVFESPRRRQYTKTPLPPQAL